MFRRLSIAVLLATMLPSGCASLSDDTISLVAQKRTPTGWPFKRPADPQASTSQSTSSRSLRETQKKSADASTQRFLESLPPDLRARIETELADLPADERFRLLAYLATVDPSRIPALLDARRKQAESPKPAAPPVVITAEAVGQPTIELAASEVSENAIQQAAAESPAQALPVAPVPRPKRNPLIEIQGVEFEDAPAEAQGPAPKPQPNPFREIVQASNEQTEPQFVTPPRIERGPTLTGTLEQSEPATPAAPPTTQSGPLAKLKEWTTIRKPELPSSTSEPPVQTAMAPVDASSLSLQSLGRRLRGTPTKPESAAAEPHPTSHGESPHLQETIQRLIALMEAETARLKPGTSFAEREEYIRRHAELRMLYLMSRQPTLALQAIPETESDTQEFWTSMMWSMSSYFDGESMADPSDRAAATLDRLRAAEQFLQTSARLELKSLSFCDKIDGFGSYHPFENQVFRAGQEVLLYAEVRNFKTDVTSAGRYRTSLKSTIEILKAGADGELIERRHFSATEDQSRSPRTDYFHSYKLDLPLHLTPGNYILRLTLEDELSGKIGASSIDFLVR